ncbi:transketolase family protein [Achromobacter xylosoxidans]|uniref:transketolase family protein n=1 Tax=Alcaligenes xylosoxydans xylosoxydans TaxID=85698 RepID=UPI001F145AEF|nr:transketolase [Achromobacter xylosoxidans]
MRKAFASAILAHSHRDDFFFLTGDLGFMALEEIQAAFGERFVNAGVAEQNMVGVAAGLARENLQVVVYSIAPFCYARPFEQIRNDLRLGNLPVCLVGNGGGYAYGHMGPTHHALEDCAAMNALGVRVLVPAFDEDLPSLLEHFGTTTYLRLGYDAKPAGQMAPEYAPWREVLSGECGAIAALGPLAGIAWQALADLPKNARPSVWAVCEFNNEAIPARFLGQIAGKPLYVLEEHVAQGGLGMNLAFTLVERGLAVEKLVHRPALGYPTGRFGSQNFHRAQCGLDGSSIRAMVVR